jgi:hypothetical protein
MNDVSVHVTRHSWLLYTPTLFDNSRFSFHTDVRASPPGMFPPSLSSVPLTCFVKSGAAKQTSNYESIYRYSQRYLMQEGKVGDGFCGIEADDERRCIPTVCIFSVPCQRTVTRI